MKFLLFLFSFLISLSSTYACTVFKVKTDSVILIGSNEDWNKLNTSARVWFTPKTATKYAVSYFGFEIHQGFAQSALNEKGLFYDGADTPVEYVNHNNTKPIYDGDIYQKIMEECANVDEAVAMLNMYSFGEHSIFTRGHMIFVDSSSNSAVIEWNNGKMKIIKGREDFQVITNFTLIEDPSVKPTCDRYEKCRLAKVNGKLNSIKEVNALLDSVSQKGEVLTAVSKIYDLTNGYMTLRYPELNDSTFKIDIYNSFKDTTYFIPLPPPNPDYSFNQNKLYDLNDTVFYNDDWVITENEYDREYYRLVEFREKNDSTSYYVQDYYLDGTTQMTAYYRSIAEMVLDLKHGKAMWFHRNGTKRSEGNYIEGKKDGVWYFWNSEAELTKVTNYDEYVVLNKKNYN